MKGVPGKLCYTVLYNIFENCKVLEKQVNFVELKELIDKVNSLSETDIPFLFFFQTKNVSEIRHILRCDNFVVDSENRVKVIENPIHNLSVKDLYLKEIAGIETISLPVTTIQADSAEYHYGVVDKNMTASRKIILKNTGKEVFRIKGTTTSCDCMIAGNFNGKPFLFFVKIE